MAHQMASESIEMPATMYQLAECVFLPGIVHSYILEIVDYEIDNEPSGYGNHESDDARRDDFFPGFLVVRYRSVADSDGSINDHDRGDGSHEPKDEVGHVEDDSRYGFEAEVSVSQVIVVDSEPVRGGKSRIRQEQRQS